MEHSNNQHTFFYEILLVHIKKINFYKCTYTFHEGVFHRASLDTSPAVYSRCFCWSSKRNSKNIL